MNAFLKTLAGYVLNTYGEKKLEELSFVFPNRRSGIFFKHYLLEAGKGSFWMPEVLTINEFISGFSKIETADPIDISFELYTLYSKLATSPQTYDEFYYWGDMLISDFDDLDKYLVPADKLFQNVVDLKEIEQLFGGFDEEQLEIIREFWAHFSQSGLSSEKISFLEMWKLLHPLYTELNKNLRGRGTGYEGMLYREVAESVDTPEFQGVFKEKVIIAGFNALNNAEKKLFRYLKNTGKGLFFWDYDEEYVKNTIPEAGRFLRKNLEDFPPVDFGESFNHLNKEKIIGIYDLPSDLLQGKYLGKLLNSELPTDYENFDNTAVILGDETLLEPVLSSLPESIPYVNVTMGYPLAHTPVYSFTDQLLKLQKTISKQTDNKEERFYHRDVLDILNHQYLRYIIDEDVKILTTKIHTMNMIYVAPDLFSHNPLLKKIFRKVHSALEMPVYLRDILEEVIALFFKETTTDEKYTLEKEYTFHIITRINKLEAVFQNSPSNVGADTFSRLFRKIISNSRIPFQGEPLRGLQIMGILESRLLDFKNIIFLSMNEGVMPRAHSAFSFIPANLRYAFGMPGREDHDAIYAYYFYRLIQRAENISILYNSKTDGIHSGEKSRYLYQIQYLSKYKPVIKTVSFHISGTEPQPIIIEKTDDSLSKLREYTGKGTKSFSPTAINTWIDCRLKFYLTYIAGLKEEDEVSEEIDAPVMGNLLHETMQLIYRDFKGKVVDQKTIAGLADEPFIDNCLKEAFRNKYFKTKASEPYPTLEGKNIIVYEVIKSLVKQIIHKDTERAPFTILELEKKFTGRIHIDGLDVNMYGIIDRIDLQEGEVHIIDYKTGNVEMTFGSVEELFDRENKKRNKHVLQTLFYSYLYTQSTNDVKNIIPCLYATRNIFKSDFNPRIKRKLEKNEKAGLSGFDQLKKDFEENLRLLLLDMYNPSTPFSQTLDENRCKYCAFKMICHKEGNDFEI